MERIRGGLTVIDNNDFKAIHSLPTSLFCVAKMREINWHEQTDDVYMDRTEEIIEEPLFTFDQVSTKNKETLENQIENEQKEFRNFKESGEMSESLRKKTIWFLNQATYRPDPTYPRDAIKANIEGNCLVEFQINSNGKTEDTDATCTDEVFEASTEGTLSKYEFEPDEYINPMVEVVYTLKGG